MRFVRITPPFYTHITHRSCTLPRSRTQFSQPSGLLYLHGSPVPYSAVGRHYSTSVCAFYVLLPRSRSLHTPTTATYGSLRSFCFVLLRYRFTWLPVPRAAFYFSPFTAFWFTVTAHHHHHLPTTIGSLSRTHLDHHHHTYLCHNFLHTAFTHTPHFVSPRSFTTPNLPITYVTYLLLTAYSTISVATYTHTADYTSVYQVVHTTTTTTHVPRDHTYHTPPPFLHSLLQDTVPVFNFYQQSLPYHAPFVRTTHLHIFLVILPPLISAIPPPPTLPATATHTAGVLWVHCTASTGLPATFALPPPLVLPTCGSWVGCVVGSFY